MPKEKLGLNDFISASGMSFELIKRLVRIVEGAKGTDDDLRKLLNEHEHSVLAHSIGQLLVSKLPLALIDVRELKFDVDPAGHTIDELINLANFTREKIKISTGIKAPRTTSRARLQVVRISVPSTENHVEYHRALITELHKMGLKLASVHQFLSFACKYRSIVQQVALIFPHEEIEIMMYGGSPWDLTLRWEPCTYLHQHNEHNLLAYAN